MEIFYFLWRAQLHKFMHCYGRQSLTLFGERLFERGQICDLGVTMKSM